MSYENQLIREMTEGADLWCSQCERTAENCVCEELSDHLRETVNPAGEVCVPPPAGVHPNFPVPVLAEPSESPLDALSGAINASEGEARESTDTTLKRSVEQVASEPRGGETSFSQWLEKHDDHLHLPTSFQEWIDQNQDSIIQ